MTSIYTNRKPSHPETQSELKRLAQNRNWSLMELECIRSHLLKISSSPNLRHTVTIHSRIQDIVNELSWIESEIKSGYEINKENLKLPAAIGSSK